MDLISLKPAPTASHAPLSNIVLGTFAVEDGTSECEWNWSHPVLVTGGRIGSHTGYASALDALYALKELTADNEDAAAVLKQDGRFYGQKLKEQGSRYGVDFDHAEFFDVHAPRPGKYDPRLVMIVDGRFDTTF
jgi:hypothetical protein